MTADCINCVTKWCAKSGKYSFEDTCEDFVPITTNADRIRSMSDEELAEFIANAVDCCNCKHPRNGCSENDETCAACWLGWLKEECIK